MTPLSTWDVFYRVGLWVVQCSSISTMVYLKDGNPCRFGTSVDHVHFERAVEVSDFPPVDADNYVIGMCCQ